MKLQYRGVSYEHNFVTEATETTEGKFRGRRWTSHHQKQRQKPSGLVYRGVAIKQSAMLIAESLNNSPLLLGEGFQ